MMKLYNNKPLSKLIYSLIGFVLVLFSFSFDARAHNYSTASLHMSQHPKTGAVELLIEAFHHDLDPALRKLCREFAKKPNCDSDGRLRAELEKTLVLRYKDKKLDWSYVGSEDRLRQKLIHLEINRKIKVDDITVRFDFLKRFYPKQKNKVSRTSL